jgi:hypothetical protein
VAEGWAASEMSRAIREAQQLLQRSADFPRYDGLGLSQAPALDLFEPLLSLPKETLARSEGGVSFAAVPETLDQAPQDGDVVPDLLLVVVHVQLNARFARNQTDRRVSQFVGGAA